VNEDPSPPEPRHSAAPTPVSPARLQRALASYQELRARGRALMANLRTSMFELQAQRQHQREQPANASRDPVEEAAQRWRAYGLTRRELEVALLLAQGCSNVTVARRLNISPHTARHHTQRVLDKLGVHSRAAAGARLRQ
jgi:DNA-binding NarL/FixJ family response regulator